MKPVICMVAPNGARRTKSDHQAIPLTPDELAHTAQSVVAAGATALHLHVRDADGKHSLNVDLYRQAIDAIGNVCGQALLLQVTTEAAGIYEVQQQIELIYDLQPQAVSLSVRELAAATQQDISALDIWMRDHQVLPQWILYNENDLQQYKSWVKEGVLSGTAYPVLFVLGNYVKNIVAEVEMLDAFLPSMSSVSCWMVCAFGHTEQAVMKSVIANGGHMRVGFENNIWRLNHEQVKDNAELVSTALFSVGEQGLVSATGAQTRQLLTPQW